MFHYDRTAIKNGAENSSVWLEDLAPCTKDYISLSGNVINYQGDRMITVIEVSNIVVTVLHALYPSKQFVHHVGTFSV